jgi:hypothetical protein
LARVSDRTQGEKPKQPSPLATNLGGGEDLNLIHGLLILAVFLYIGMGCEIGIQADITATGTQGVLGEIILIAFVCIIIFGAANSMRGTV